MEQSGAVGYGDRAGEAEGIHHGTEWQHGAGGAVLEGRWVNGRGVIVFES